MDSDLISNILIFLGFVVISAVFSSAETSYSSLNTIRLTNEAHEGDQRAKQVLELEAQFDQLLSSILIGNNIANIASSAIATVFFVKLNPIYGPAIATGVTTFILLLFGEITPKLVAKLMPERLAKLLAPFLRMMMFIFTPINWILSMWQKMVRRFINVEEEPSISEEELLFLVDEAKDEGSLEDDEHQLVRAAIQFDDINISAIYTPRVDVVAFDVHSTDEEIEQLFHRYPYSRLIVYEDTIDNVIGAMHERDFHRYIRAKQHNNLTKVTKFSLLTEVLFVPSVMILSELLRLMQQEQIHMGIVVDEHGGMMGIVTMEDVLEELVGEIFDERDVEENKIRPTDNPNIFQVEGSTELVKFFDAFSIEDEHSWISSTVGGFVIEQFGHVPEVGDQLIFHHLLLTVSAAQKRKITSITVEIKEDKLKSEETDD